ncbi:hypothetical protein SARC_06335 [Sphaeroforma arctica JP610]|uniref:FAD-binding FR-type domain-containing protein n=1 Tax=Sphaeroforma arctica JP610 TaxID=667725 RepID=A0A0L0FWX9_9EUKA|nr:hypothetical protein SARC_06335 [Sphaeroforma arctica JP610]KNC81337.1 hypothetical protein SARC_06335 [Sphaeroforma arctica JP610]|eukprot:XP_014155239.1 hypothetical protein SARC_06335 [Sphaeroforma arctica JP610]
MMKRMESLKQALINDGLIYGFFALWMGANIGLFVYTFWLFETADIHVLMVACMGSSLSLAKASAATLNLNSALILLPVCRNLVSYLRGAVIFRGGLLRLLDKNISFHKWCGYMIMLHSIIHTVAHMYNGLNFQRASEDPNFVPCTDYFVPGTPIPYYFSMLYSAAGITGMVMCIVLFLMMNASFEYLRKTNFEVFWYTHHLFIVYYIGIITHALSGLVQTVNPDGSFTKAGLTAWQWVIGPLVIYGIERITRLFRSTQRVVVAKVVQHPSNVVEIQMLKKGFKATAGQYIFIQVPTLSSFEWHPFTLTSSPEESFFSVHIRVAGDWTTSLAERLGCHWDAKGNQIVKSGYKGNPSKMPTFNVDGPFGTATSGDAFKYSTAILVGAGIGVTPFASVLKSIWYQQAQGLNMKLRKVYFIWICRDRRSFEWFQDLIEALELQMVSQGMQAFLQIDVYLTERIKHEEITNIVTEGDASEDLLHGQHTKTHFGRPHWDKIFAETSTKHANEQVGVFFCGPKVLGKVLHTKCNEYSDKIQHGGARYIFNEEVF